MSDFGSWLAQAKSKLPEEALTLPDSQGDSPLFGDEFGESFPIPQIDLESAIKGTPPERLTDLFQLLIAEPSRSAGSIAVGQAGKAFLFEPMHPIGYSAWSISQEHGDFGAVHSLRNQQHAVQSMVVTGFIRSTNLILQGQNDILGLGKMDFPHSSPRVTRIQLFRNLL